MNADEHDPRGGFGSCPSASSAPPADRWQREARAPDDAAGDPSFPIRVAPLPGGMTHESAADRRALEAEAGHGPRRSQAGSSGAWPLDHRAPGSPRLSLTPWDRPLAGSGAPRLQGLEGERKRRLPGAQQGADAGGVGGLGRGRRRGRGGRTRRRGAWRRRPRCGAHRCESASSGSQARVSPFSEIPKGTRRRTRDGGAVGLELEEVLVEALVQHRAELP